MYFCAAVIIASLYTSSVLQPRDRSLIGAFNPCRIGPTASYPPKRAAILYPVLPASILGNTNVLQCPATLEFGAFCAAATDGTDVSNKAFFHVQMNLPYYFNNSFAD